MNKQELRKEFISLRNNIYKQDIIERSRFISENILSSAQYKSANIIFAYLCFNSEVNIDIVLQRALVDKKIICIPKIISDTEMLSVKFNGFDALEYGRYGIRCIKDEIEVIDPKDIDLTFVPGVAFSEYGDRLGMGAGYYDRFLATASKSIFMGVTYDCLLDKRVPSDRYDIKMHYIVTETKLIHCK